MHPHDLSVAVFVRGLANLKTLLAKGEAHALAQGIDPVSLLRAQLASDMNDLTVQVHWSAEGAKLAVARLAGMPATPAAAEEIGTFATLHQRIDTTIAHLETAGRQALEGALDRTIDLEHRGRVTKLTGAHFLMHMAIPSFFFHLTTAYGILRHQGVPLTKGDFLGALG